MKHTLPWNVTGIPSEAREIARAAAQRDGITVGDWLTQRILAESSRTTGALQVMAAPSAASFSPGTEDEPRHGRDDLAQKLARTEMDAQSAFRRIDEALRTLARRLENSERSQGEAHRAMSLAANEINAATRDQSQAFQHLTTRIDRVERHTDTGALRDAVRGLHQGLSRLADQIAKMSTHSSDQIAALAGNVELLAGTVATAREESNHFGQALEDKVAALAERVKQNEEQIALSLLLDERLKETEDRLKQAEEHVTAPALPDEGLAKLEARMNGTEQRMQDWLGRHLTVIERNFQHIGGRLEQAEKRVASEGTIQEALLDLGARIDAAEEKNREALAELKASLSETPKHVEPVETVEAVETPAPFGDAIATAFPAVAFDFPPVADAPPFPIESEPPPQAEGALPSTPVLEAESEAQPAQASAENYLAQARRAARAAADADSDRAGRTKRRSRTPGESDSRQGRRISPAMAVAAALVLLLAGAGIAMTRMAPQQADVVAVASNRPPAKAATPVSTVPSQADAASSDSAATNAAAADPSDATNATPETNSPHAANEAAGESQQIASVVSATPPAMGDVNPLAPLIAQANKGDAKAALALGLKYADGDGVPANDSEAAVWLQKSAEAGEPIAQYRLGTLYEKGRGVGADLRQAIHWYGESAKHGNRKAMHNLAVAYADGAGAEKNFTEAARWFKSAAELGLTDSQFNLAVLYERGLGVKASLAEAYKWYAIAAASGDAESKTRITALASQIQAADREGAERAAKAYRPVAMNVAANDRP